MNHSVALSLGVLLIRTKEARHPCQWEKADRRRLKTVDASADVNKIIVKINPRPTRMLVGMITNLTEAD